MTPLRLQRRLRHLGDDHFVVRLGFGIALALLISIAVVSYRSITNFVERVALVERTQQIFLTNQEVLTLLKDAVIAQRGYAITGESRYLAPLEAGPGGMVEKLGQLRKLIGVDMGPEARQNLQRLDEIEKLGSAIFATIEQSIQLRASGASPQTPELVALIDLGKRDLDQVRKTVRDIRASANAVLLDRLHESQSTGETTTTLLIMTEAVSLALLLAAFGLLSRQVLLRTRAEAALKVTNEKLEERIAERTSELASANEQLGHEIDEHKHAREEIQLLNQSLESRVAERTAQLEESRQQMESFGYSVSHDLRAPLRAIMGYARMLEEDHGHRFDDESRALLQVIAHNSRKMGQLIDDLLSFSRLSRVDMSEAPIDMNLLAQDSADALGIDDEASATRLVLRPMPGVRGDPTLLRQVWTNLIANACKFSAGRPAPTVEIGGYSAGRENVYYVRDNGVGFDMKYASKLFGVFERLHSAEAFPGTGVGLAIVRRVVQRHSGRAWAEGVVDAGATFYFALPRVESHG